MLHNNKKGIASSLLIGIVITLVGFFVISGAIGTFMQKLPGKQADTLCRTSVAAKAKSKITSCQVEVFGSSSPVPLMCKTQEFTINAKGKTTREVIRELMGYAARTWNVWGEGNYGGGLYGNSFLSIGTDNCFRYYTVKIKNLKGTIIKSEVIDFMKNEISPKSNTTYWKYIAENTAWSGFNILDDIEDQHIYSIIFADVTYKKIGFELTHYNEIYIADLNREKIQTGEYGIIFDSPKYCNFIPGTGGE